MNFNDIELLRYCEQHSEDESDLLSKIVRTTHQRSPYPQMLSGHSQGRLLSALSRLLNPDLILEIGGFTGYGTICLAEGLKKNGRIDTIENNPEVISLLKSHLAGALESSRYSIIEGNAIDEIKKLDGPYDLVFIDADKVNYPFYLIESKRLVRIGGWILADNVLWGGKVLDTGNDNDDDTSAIREFNRMVSEDVALRNVMLPLRDGLMLAEVIA